MSEVTTLQNATAFDAGDLNGDSIYSHDAVLVRFAPAASYDGTVYFEVSPDGSNWYPVTAVGLGAGQAAVESIASPASTQLYVVHVPSGSPLRARMSGGTQGSLTVVARAATVDGGRAGSGGGGVDQAAAPSAYRSAVAAADVIAVPGTVTCTKVASGAATAGTYTVFVVAVNAYGRTTATQGNTTVTTETTNLTVRAAFAAVTGATHYDIYCSIDGVASKFVGRITEAQRGTGIKLTAVNVTGAGGIAGAVDIQVPGTGLAVNGGQLATNTAYSIPASPVDCTGYQYADFDLTFSRTGDIVASSLIVIPFFKNTRTATWHMGAVQTISFGGTAGAYSANKQRLRVEVRGNTALALVVAAIAGTGAALDVDVVLS